jgi:hypothetical protein
MLSFRAKAHTVIKPFLEQLLGLAWRQPKVCFSESAGCNGVGNALVFFITSSFVHHDYLTHSNNSVVAQLQALPALNLCLDCS